MSPSRAPITSSPEPLAVGVGLVDELVDHIVAVGRVVVEQRERLHPALGGQPHRVLDRAMPPRRLHPELLGRVLGVVDQQVDAFAQLARTVGHLEHVDAGLLVVAQVGDRRPVPRDPVAARGADVRDQARHDVDVADPEGLVADPAEVDAAGERLERDRERRRAQAGTEHVTERAPVGLRRGVDVEVRPVAQEGREEREALDVVPVQMGQQARAAERLARPVRQAVVAQAGTEVEQQRVVIGDVDRHARRVAAVARHLLAVARR